MKRTGDWIQTYTGNRFWPLDPRAEEIDIVDVAHALSNQCRFSGHVNEFYSVAEHSVRVSLEVPPKDALWGLLHDAAEAYLVDLPRPLKRSAGFAAAYSDAEEAVMLAVCLRFDLDPEMPASVKVADNRLLSTERRDLLKPLEWNAEEVAYEPLPFVIQPWEPRVARDRFMARYRDLMERRAVGAAAEVTS